MYTNMKATGEELTHFQVRLKPDLIRRIKLQAMLNGMTAQALVNRVLDGAIAQVEITTRKAQNARTVNVAELFGAREAAR